MMPEQTDDKASLRTLTFVFAIFVLCCLSALTGFEYLVNRVSPLGAVAYFAVSSFFCLFWLRVVRRQKHFWSTVVGICIGVCFIFCSILSFANAFIVGRLADYPSWSRQEVASVSMSSAPQNAVLLEDNSCFKVYGRARSVWKRFRGVETDNNTYMWHKLFDEGIIPKEFIPFARNIDPSRYSHLDSSDTFNETKIVAAQWVSWSYPDFLPLIVTANGDKFVFQVDNRMGDQGIYSLVPLLKDMFRFHLSNHFRIYSRTITYFFKSPHYRRDILADPAFVRMKRLAAKKTCFYDNH